jgi:hypothetical protein
MDRGPNRLTAEQWLCCALLSCPTRGFRLDHACRAIFPSGPLVRVRRSKRTDNGKEGRREPNLTRDETAVDSRTDQEEEEERWNEEDEEDEKQNRENEEDEEVYSDDQ